MTKPWKLKDLALEISIVVFTALLLSKIIFQGLITLTNHIVGKHKKKLEGIPMKNNIKKIAWKIKDVLRNIVSLQYLQFLLVIFLGFLL